MKKTLMILLIMLVSVACKKENNPISKIKEATDKVKEVKTGIDNLDKIVNGAEDMQKEIEKLSKITPVSKEAIKAWMPEKLDDLKRSSYKLGKNGYVNITTLKLEYNDPENKSKKIAIELIDGAGNGSAAIYMYKLIQNTDMESESETGYEKTYKRGDVFIKEKYQKENYGNRTKMEFLINDRFAVNTTGYGMKSDELWKYLNELKLNDLK